ncbi:MULTISPECIES: hypothetical protein [unclassified Janthinobacterium]|uniref:hypothetical protein n=1 Tax=unclassified Janthinobacterium TaxID=2610881 RepID=UPI00161BB29E|nr:MULTISPECIES: hypothetical protein [unclassified Janthinobacterium]MBB5608059.1 hypothetical protein [Janthinobacterium sp. S3T4]MBB5613200.1 hypothetical protein [Janthinobacterium sp. S3M3]
MLYQRSPSFYDTIFTKKGIFEESDYSRITSQGNGGVFSYEKYNNNGELSVVTVSPVSVLRTYTNLIFLSDSMLSRVNPVSMAKFPDTIKNELIRDSSGMQSDGHYVKEYFTIVRSAGGFSERISS